MPWKECRKVDEKLKLVSRFLDGEKIAVLCREFGISRATRPQIHRPVSAMRGAGRHGPQPSSVSQHGPLETTLHPND
jgi:putative transposase